VRVGGKAEVADDRAETGVQRKGEAPGARGALLAGGYVCDAGQWGESLVGKQWRRQGGGMKA
jgi:hypothetical protein